MANSFLYAAFERFWGHILSKFDNFVSNEKFEKITANLATEEYVDNKVSSLVSNAPEALDTLNELSQALGSDPNFATTITLQLTEMKTKIENLNDEDFFTSSTEPSEAVNGDFWIDTSEDTIAQKKIYEQPVEPANSNDGDLWVDTSDMI